MSLSTTQKLSRKVPEIQDLLLANCVRPSDSSSLWGLSFAAAAADDFADSLKLFGAVSYFTVYFHEVVLKFDASSFATRI